MDKKKKIILGAGILVAAGVGYYLYKKSQAPVGPTPEEILAAQQAQAKQENIEHLLQIGTDQAKLIEAGGKAALQVPDVIKQSTTRSGLNELIKFGTATAAKPVAGLGAYAFS